MYTKYFKAALESHGYTDFEVGYSISYSQGDGVAWWGTLHSDDLRVIAERLYSTFNIFNLQEKLQMKKHLTLINQVLDFVYHFGSGSVSVTVTNSGNYFHARSMSLGWDEEFEYNYPGADGPNSDIIEDTLGYRLTYDDMSTFQLVWDELMEDIQQDIESLSEQLYRDGRAINESSYQYGDCWDEDIVVYERNSENYKVQLIVNVSLNTLSNLSDWDCSLHIVESFLSGKLVWGELRAKIIDSNTGKVLSVSYGGADTFYKDEKKFYSLRRELVSQAIEELRGNIEEAA